MKISIESKNRAGKSKPRKVLRKGQQKPAEPEQDQVADQESVTIDIDSDNSVKESVPVPAEETTHAHAQAPATEPEDISHFETELESEAFAPVRARDPYITNYPDTLNPTPGAMWELEEKIGYNFKNRELLMEALMHSSANNLFDPPVQNNQRLEFLGDAVLGLIVGSFLFKTYPEAGEGLLTKSRAHLVNKSGIYERAMNIGLGNHIIMGRSEETNGGRTRVTAIVDAFEALMGAVHLDGGYAQAEKLVQLVYRDIYEDTSEIPTQTNPKGELQEILQAYESSEPPTYEMTNIIGPEHDREFECIVTHSGVELSRGRGRSKKAAEIMAASEALNFLEENPEFCDSLDDRHKVSESGPEEEIKNSEDPDPDPGPDSTD